MQNEEFVEEQVFISLCFYAFGSFYQVVGDSIDVDKPTVSTVVKAVSSLNFGRSGCSVSKGWRDFPDQVQVLTFE